MPHVNILQPVQVVASIPQTVSSPVQASPTIFSANVPEVKEQAPLNKRETTLEDVRRIIRGQHPGAYYVNVHASDDSANNVELEKRHWESNDTKRTNSSESSYLIGKGLRGLFNNLIDKTIGKLEDALVDDASNGTVDYSSLADCKNITITKRDTEGQDGDNSQDQQTLDEDAQDSADDAQDSDDETQDSDDEAQNDASPETDDGDTQNSQFEDDEFEDFDTQETDTPDSDAQDDQTSADDSLDNSDADTAVDDDDQLITAESVAEDYPKGGNPLKKRDLEEFNICESVCDGGNCSRCSSYLDEPTSSTDMGPPMATSVPPITFSTDSATATDLPTNTDSSSTDLPTNTDSSSTDLPTNTDSSSTDMPTNTDSSSTDLPSSTDSSSADPATTNDWSSTDWSSTDLPTSTDSLYTDIITTTDWSSTDLPTSTGQPCGCNGQTTAACCPDKFRYEWNYSKINGPNSCSTRLKLTDSGPVIVYDCPKSQDIQSEGSIEYDGTRPFWLDRTGTRDPREIGLGGDDDSDYEHDHDHDHDHDNDGHDCDDDDDDDDSVEFEENEETHHNETQSGARRKHSKRDDSPSPRYTVKTIYNIGVLDAGEHVPGNFNLLSTETAKLEALGLTRQSSDGGEAYDVRPGTSFVGGNIDQKFVPSLHACLNLCSMVRTCRAITYAPNLSGACYLKDSSARIELRPDQAAAQRVGPIEALA